MKPLLLQYTLYIFESGKTLKGKYPDFNYRHAKFETTLHAWLYWAERGNYAVDPFKLEYVIRGIFMNDIRILDVWIPLRTIRGDCFIPQEWFLDTHNALVDYERGELSDNKLVLK